MAESSKDKNSRARMLVKVSEALAKSGSIDISLQVADRIDDNYWKTISFGKILEAASYAIKQLATVNIVKQALAAVIFGR